MVSAKEVSSSTSSTRTALMMAVPRAGRRSPPVRLLSISQSGLSRTVHGRAVTRSRRTATALGVFAGVAALLVLPACSSGDDSDDTATVASLGDSSTETSAASTDSSTASEEDFQQAMLDYAQCMRDHGI